MLGRANGQLVRCPKGDSNEPGYCFQSDTSDWAWGHQKPQIPCKSPFKIVSTKAIPHSKSQNIYLALKLEICQVAEKYQGVNGAALSKCFSALYSVPSIIFVLPCSIRTLAESGRCASVHLFNEKWTLVVHTFIF